MDDPGTRENMQFLEENGYKYLYDRDLFVNYQSKKCFSLEFVDDNPNEIQELALQPNPTGGWEFHFNREPSLALQQEIAQVLADAA